MNLEGKKLLVISSDGSDMTFVNAARSLGAYIICCDRYSDWKRSPAKMAADEAWDMDYSDTEAVAQRCREVGVDGVIAGYAEDRVLAASRISKAIGTPFYATEEQINITRNKRLFKELCSQYGVPTPKEYCHMLPMTEEEMATVQYPVIVKPSDNGGRRGISVCRNEAELLIAIEEAADLSKTGEVVVEDYLQGTELCAVYTLSDGKISLSCLNDKYPSESNTKLCDVVISPSQYYQYYIETVDLHIKAFLQGIGAKNGVANFQLIAQGDEIKAFEMGYRINGNDDYKIVRHANGLDFSKMLVTHSLTGSMGNTLEADNPVFDGVYCTLVSFVRGGTIGRIDSSALEGKEGIIDISNVRCVGNEVLDNGTNTQKAAMVKMHAETIDKIIELIRFVQKHFIFEDVNGADMIASVFDANRLRKECE